MNKNTTDEKFMRRALALAASQRGKTSPDPMVGAVLVKGGKIIAEGYHGAITTPHAEAWAIEKAGEKAQGATLYVNLEPCCHFGNNPPCTTQIIAAGIKKVVAAMRDPNPLVSGKGFKILKKANIKVQTGLLKKEAFKLNEYFIKYISRGRPFIILKAASSLDGKIATHTGDSRWISSFESRSYTHNIRNQVDAILVGINTIIKDNPRLTVRLAKKIKNPISIILDTNLKIPPRAKILNVKEAPTIIITSNHAPHKKIIALKKKGIKVIIAKTSKGKINLKKLIKTLGQQKITSVLVEGGGQVTTSFLEAGLVDKLIVSVAPKLIGGAKAVSWFSGNGVARVKDSLFLKEVLFLPVGNDMLIEGYL